MLPKSLGAALLLTATLAMPSHAQDITLRVDTTPSIFADLFRELVTGFETANPGIRLDIDTSQRDQNETLQRTLRQAVVGDLPDVSFQGFNYLKTLAEQGHIQPLDDLIASDSGWTRDEYSPSVADTGRVSDTTYGLGVAFAFPIIYYNANLVAEVQGGDKSLPDNWDGILDVARRIQEAHPEVLGAFTRYNAFLTQGHIFSQGGSLGNAEGTEVSFTDEAGLAAFELFARFGELGQGKIDLTDSQARQSFGGGRIGILADSSSSLENFLRQAGGRFEIRTTHFPFAENGKLPTSGIAAVIHTSDPKRQEAAWKFLRFVTGPEGQNLVGRRTGYVPANEVAVKRADLLGDYYAANPAISGTLASIPYATAWYEFSGPNALQINKLFTERLQQVVTLKQPAREAALALGEEITTLLAQ